MNQCKKGIDCLQCNSRGMCYSYADFKYQQGYNKAIDEFVERIDKHVFEEKSEEQYSNSVSFMREIKQIAEQMKAGE